MASSFTRKGRAVLNVMKPSSSTSSFTGGIPEIITFNVGGTPITTGALTPFLRENPNNPLSQLVQSTPPTATEIFLDHNPLAFNIIIDYFRYGHLLCPRNVCPEVIHLQLREFGIPYDPKDIKETNDEGLPPSYEAASAANQGSQGGFWQSKLGVGVNAALAKRLDALLHGRIVPLVTLHAQQGHKGFAICLIPPDIQGNEVAAVLGDKIEHHSSVTGGIMEFVPLAKTGQLGQGYMSSNSSPLLTPTSSTNHISTVPSQSSTPWMLGTSSSATVGSAPAFGKSSSKAADDDELPDMPSVLQSGVPKALEELVGRGTGCRKVSAESTEVVLRVANAFGLFDSRSVAVLVLILTLA
ncbi:hypothetical protein HK102_008304 [Quaeritorhiza haematococci]|nr:hypothetical protein HK102_008304 [Quaeritorhiza haematococci]